MALRSPTNRAQTNAVFSDVGTLIFAVVTDFDRNCLLGKGVLVVAYHTPVVIYDILG